MVFKIIFILFLFVLSFWGDTYRILSGLSLFDITLVLAILKVFLAALKRQSYLKFEFRSGWIFYFYLERMHPPVFLYKIYTRILNVDQTSTLVLSLCCISQTIIYRNFPFPLFTFPQPVFHYINYLFITLHIVINFNKLICF